MENNQNSKFAIIPEYEVLKKGILGEFVLAKQNIATYLQSPTPLNEKTTRDSVIQLAMSLEFKSYFLDETNRTRFDTLMSKPFHLKSANLFLLFKLSHLILELSGLTKLESSQASELSAYLED